MSNRRRPNKPWLAIPRPLNVAEVSWREVRRKNQEAERERLLGSNAPPSTRKLREWLNMLRD